MVEDSEWGRIRYCQVIRNGLWTWEIICTSKYKRTHRRVVRRKTLCRKSAVNWRLGYYWVGCYKGSWWRRRRWQYDGCDTRTWDWTNETSFRSQKLRSSFWSDFSTYLLKRKSSGSPKRDEKVWQSNRKPSQNKKETHLVEYSEKKGASKRLARPNSAQNASERRVFIDLNSSVIHVKNMTTYRYMVDQKTYDS